MPRARRHDPVDRIASWVVGGRYIPGSTLPTEAAIGAELGVSRTVVREALKTLVAKGLIVTGPRLGTRVRPRAEWNLFDPDVVNWRLDAGVDAAFVHDLLELRTVIEPSAVRLAARAGTAVDLAAGEAAFRAMVRATEGHGSYLQADLDFHQFVLLATHNQFIVGMAQGFGELLSVSFRLSITSLAKAKASLPAHRRVLDAIAARNPDAAEAAMLALIGTARADLDAQRRRRPRLPAVGAHA